jgi:hypothetical protein
LLISSCGFSPVYSSAQKANIPLSTIQIDSSIDKPDEDDTVIYLPRKVLQTFNTELNNVLNPEHENSNKRYRLQVKLRLSHTPLLIQQDHTITRSRVSLSAKYRLTSLVTKEIVSSGEISREGEYDQVESDYATFVSQQDTVVRVTKEIAEGLKIRLISALPNESTQ